MFLWSRIKTYLAASAVILGAVLAVYLRGKKDAEDDYQHQVDQYLIKVMRRSREVEDEVGALDDIGLGERASRWLRNADQQ